MLEEFKAARRDVNDSCSFPQLPPAPRFFIKTCVEVRSGDWGQPYTPLSTPRAAGPAPATMGTPPRDLNVPTEGVTCKGSWHTPPYTSVHSPAVLLLSGAAENYPNLGTAFQQEPRETFLVKRINENSTFSQI